jgi:hypothetical protein
MFTRRLATFLLGIWLGCCLLIDLQALQKDRAVAHVVDNPSDQARTRITAATPQIAGQLLRHMAGEQIRSSRSDWELVQGVIAVTMIVLMIFTDQRKPVALALCVLMGALAFIQHFMITPEWNYVGRELDFLDERASFTVASRNWTLTQLYGGTEILKLLLGGVLASYFFAMESTVKRKKSRHRSQDEGLEVPLKSA